METRAVPREVVHALLDRYVAIAGVLVDSPRKATMMIPPSGWLLQLGDRYPKPQVSGMARVVDLRGVRTDVGMPMEIRGRLAFHMSLSSIPTICLYVDAAGSRWTGASVAGLVVGAMGVLIFGLHLRRWLGVRRLALDARGVFTAEDAEDAEKGKDG